MPWFARLLPAPAAGLVVKGRKGSWRGTRYEQIHTSPVLTAAPSAVDKPSLLYLGRKWGETGSTPAAHLSAQWSASTSSLDSPLASREESLPRIQHSPNENRLRLSCTLFYASLSITHRFCAFTTTQPSPLTPWQVCCLTAWVFSYQLYLFSC